MSRLCFRLVTALLTFAVGLGASALFGAWSAPSKPQAAPAAAGIFVVAPRVEAVPPVLAAAAPQAEESGPRIVVGGILNRKAVSKPMPDYPAAAKAARAEGPVIVHLVVGADGRVETARAISGHPLLQQAAAEAVSRWRFSPTRLSGEPVRVSGTAIVKFSRR